MKGYFLKTNPAWYIPRQHKEYVFWLLRGKVGPMPHIAKRQLIKFLAGKFGLSTLVETGTYLGEMITSVKKSFSEIYSIELSPELAELASLRFYGLKHIHIIEGDSENQLSSLLNKIHTPTLFWLDAHYSGGVTGRGELDSPIINELLSIFSQFEQKHIILIDDARLFVGRDGYPTMPELRRLVAEKRPSWICEVKYDVIIIAPA